MTALDQETINFAFKAGIVVAAMCAGIVAPTAGLVIFSKVAVRLSSPLIEGELLKSQSFIDRVAQLAEHKVANGQAKLLGSYEILVARLLVLDKLAEDMHELKKDVAVLMDRSKKESA